MATYSYTCSPAAKRPVGSGADGDFIDPPELVDKHFLDRPAAKGLNKLLRAGDRLHIAFVDFASHDEAVKFMRHWDFLGVEIEFTDADTQPGWETFRGSVEKFMNAVQAACTGPDADTLEVC